MNEETTTQYIEFPETPKATKPAPVPTPEVVQQDREPIVTPPNKGLTPEQVREHYGSSTSVESAAPNEEIATEPQLSTPPIQKFNSSVSGVSVDLPSKFAFYSFSELLVHPLRSKHLAKLSRAHKEKSARLTGEVVSSVLEIPGISMEGIAFQLSLPDYYWVLYYLRKNCYTKVYFKHKTRCTNPRHIQQVMEGHKKPESLIISTKIDTTKLEVTDYTPVEIPEEIKHLNPRCPTFGDFVKVVEDSRFGESEFEFLAQLACIIAPELTWDERLQLAEELLPEEVEAIKQYEKAVTNFGVVEKATVTCGDCGASNETILSIDASAFLPSA